MNRILKAVQIGLVSSLLVLFCFTGTAYARGGCFGAGTPILTPNGYQPVEQLSESDHLIGWNFSENHTEVESIGEIQVAQADNYYLLNGSIQVTGSHPFYVQKPEHTALVEVHNLKLGDTLIGENNIPISITSIRHIQAPLDIYNLINVTPSHNFYANGILVHNKGGGGGGSGGGGGGYGYGHNGAASELTADNVPGMALAIFVLIVALIPFAFMREIYNTVRFKNVAFTDDADLIEFTTGVNENFLNTYSAKYCQDNEPWLQVPLSEGITAEEYQSLISDAELKDLVSQLFIQYQHDWTNKNFDAMKDYLEQPFYSLQEHTFSSSFGQGFDIVYQPTVMEIAVITCEKAEDSYQFKCQINAELINFFLSAKGSVLSGEAIPRAFTEYWDIRIDSDHKCHLAGIDRLYEFSKIPA